MVGVVAGLKAGHKPGGRAGAWSWRAAGYHVGLLLVVGVLVGVTWALLTPVIGGWSDGGEQQVAGEVTMAGLGVLAGLVLAVIGLLRPGPGATGRFALSLLGSVAGALLAWGVGRLLGAPVLAAPGVLVLWPLTLAAVTVVVTLVATVFGRQE